MSTSLSQPVSHTDCGFEYARDRQGRKVPIQSLTQEQLQVAILNRRNAARFSKATLAYLMPMCEDPEESSPPKSRKGRAINRRRKSPSQVPSRRPDVTNVQGRSQSFADGIKYLRQQRQMFLRGKAKLEAPLSECHPQLTLFPSPPDECMAVAEQNNVKGTNCTHASPQHDSDDSGSHAFEGHDSENDLGASDFDIEGRIPAKALEIASNASVEHVQVQCMFRQDGSGGINHHMELSNLKKVGRTCRSLRILQAAHGSRTAATAEVVSTHGNQHANTLKTEGPDDCTTDD